MVKFEGCDILHDRLIRRIADAYTNDDKETFEYATQIFDQITESRRINALSQIALNLEVRIGLDGKPLDCQVQQAPESEEQTPEPTPLDLSIFETMPNRRESLSAITKNGVKAYFNHSIAKKLYRCYSCHNDIAIGSEHVVMGLEQKSKKHNHHHVHHKCLHEKLLPTLHNIRVLNPNKTTAAKIIKKNKKIGPQPKTSDELVWESPNRV